MNIFGIHFCQDELFAILAMIPLIGLSVPWLKSKFHRDHKDCHEGEEAPSTPKSAVWAGWRKIG